MNNHDVIKDDKRQKKFLLGLFGIMLLGGVVSASIIGAHLPKQEVVVNKTTKTETTTITKHQNIQYYVDEIIDILNKNYFDTFYQPYVSKTKEYIKTLENTPYNRSVLENKIKRLNEFKTLKINNTYMIELLHRVDKYTYIDNLKQENYVVNNVDLYTNEKYLVEYKQLQEIVFNYFDGVVVEHKDLEQKIISIENIVKSIFMIALISNNIKIDNNSENQKKLFDYLNQIDLNQENLRLVKDQLEQLFHDMKFEQWYKQKGGE